MSPDTSQPHGRLGVEPIEIPAEHVHEWQPNGNVEVDRSSLSPCSTWDDQLWTDVVALAVCGCGAVQRTVVGRKNLRRRGDALTKGNRRG